MANRLSKGIYLLAFIATLFAEAIATDCAVSKKYIDDSLLLPYQTFDQDYSGTLGWRPLSDRGCYSEAAAIGRG